MERDIDKLGNIHMNQKGLWTYEFYYKGKRYRNKGCVSRENCEISLLKKREEAKLFETARQDRESEVCAGQTPHRHVIYGRIDPEIGLTGSIYQVIKKNDGKRKKSDSIMYTAEINRLGCCYRKSSKNKAICEEWLVEISRAMNDVYRKARAEEKIEIDRINALIDESNEKIKEIQKQERFDIQNVVDRFRQVRKENGELVNKSLHAQTYLMLDRSNGIYKIGKSKDPVKRLQCMTNQYVSLVAVFPADIEKMLHIRFRNKLVHGEWFALSEDDVNQLVEEGFEKVF